MLLAPSPDHFGSILSEMNQKGCRTHWLGSVKRICRQILGYSMISDSHLKTVRGYQKSISLCPSAWIGDAMALHFSSVKMSLILSVK